MNRKPTVCYLQLEPTSPATFLSLLTAALPLERDRAEGLRHPQSSF